MKPLKEMSITELKAAMFDIGAEQNRLHGIAEQVMTELRNKVEAEKKEQECSTTGQTQKQE